MTSLELTSIDSLPPTGLTVVNFDVNRKWKITALIVSAISIISIIIIIVVTFTRSQSYHSTDELITTTTKHLIDGKEEATTMTDNNASIIYSPYPITEFYGYQSFGFSLSHSIYFNVYRIGEIQGYVTSVTLRLFTDWKGDNPLYIFAINQLSTRHCEITHRYPIIPKRNNIEWQTIQIPLQIFPIFNNNFIAIGMQDESNTNQIYAVKAPISIGGENITNDTRYFYIKGNEGLYGIAFMYTVFPNGCCSILALLFREEVEIGLCISTKCLGLSV